MKIGFVGLGNVGGKLCGSLLRGGMDLVVRDLDPALVRKFTDLGASPGGSPADMMRQCEVVITCLPSPSASAEVVEGPEGLLLGMGEGKVWLEMSTTDQAEVQRLGARVIALGGAAADCPVSGGCHRAASGNISIFAGCEREVFERILPLLSIMGRQILHTGQLGSASLLKVMTNYLATVNLVSCCEAMVTMRAAGMDLNTTFEAIRISSGNSFVHETESQVILNGSRDISFTMKLVEKDIGLFQAIAAQHRVPLELSPLLIRIFKDGIERYGADAQSDDIIRRLEDATGLDITAPGFPAEMQDSDPPQPGYEVFPPGRPVSATG